MNANESQTLFLPAGQVLSVVAASGASGSAIRMAKLPGGGDAQSITAIAGASLTFGPYAATERFEIICTAGTLTIATAFETASRKLESINVFNSISPLAITAGSSATMSSPRFRSISKP